MKPLLKRISNSPSKLTLWSLFLIVVFLAFTVGPEMYITWDTIGYSAYFTELIVNGDLFFQDLDHYEYIVSTYENSVTLYQFTPLEDGSCIPKYTIGWALLNAPFLYFGHLIALLFGYPLDGYSAPYQYATLISSLFYTFLGLYLSRKLLIKFFSERITALLLIIMVLGTNYLNMHYESIAIVHIYLVPFYALLILLTIKFHERNSIRTAIFIGLVLGIMTLVRPTEMLAAIIPLSYGIKSVKSLSIRFKHVFLTKYYYIAIALFIGVYGLQMLYWKATTGEFLFYSYPDPGEGLDLDNPHLVEVLFSFRKGWLIYTPIMIFSFIGLIRIVKFNKDLALPLISFFLINLYVISSWTNWWYASSYSIRPLTQIYPLCLILIGYSIYQLKNTPRKMVFGLMGIFILLNLFQTWQFHHRIIHLDRMSFPYYISIFGQTTEPTEEQEKLLLIDRSQMSFENLEDYKLIDKSEIEIPSNFILSESNPYSPGFVKEYNQITEKDHVWIRIYASLSLTDSLPVNDLHLHVWSSAQHKGQRYNWRNVTANSISSDTIIRQDYVTPYMRSTTDSIAFGVWLQHGSAVNLNGIEYEIYEPQ